ncbi:hypothetical protein AB6N35_14250 [Dietzia cinnamea]|uniref:Integral membrane protein n=1 Tax=Dietzia cinnamea TaxID=321318 RepID=A0ABV3YKI9_9ACTN|nr:MULTISPECIES: hypothetical protein [Dietzia]AVM65301.1 hypothetical protein C3V38_13930 [Dietzia sp. oral taxon 368]MCT1711057.1 hypothetical protein [Dietzia cinnamea]MCT1884384.1 hypothetical protein [Dietzia cinnamea]MCT2263118.1 hypothetical protein [Dietzia cinnamea]MCT2273898.1 hypothetical protein [Dietzia cinnamea]
MDIVFNIVLILHFIGLAGIIGGWLATIKAPHVNKAILHGAILQVVTGLLLVGLREMDDVDVNHMKIGIKLVIALVILVVAILGVRKEARAQGTTATLAHVAGALGIVNVAIAVFV